MISCNQCHTLNSLDSKFCKRCGAEIPEVELTEARSKLDRLIEEGNSLFNQARVDEALAIADAAAIADPSSVSALSLKALCHERRGEIAEALEAADRIVELNPSSDIDRIRRSALRQKLQAEYHLADVPDRKVATLGGVAAIVLVVCTGVFFAHLLNSPAARVADSNTLASTVLPQTAIQAPPTTGGTTTGSQPQSSRQDPPPSGQANEGSQQNDSSDQNQGNDNGERDTTSRNVRRNTEAPAPRQSGRGLPGLDDPIEIAPYVPPAQNPKPAAPPDPTDGNVGGPTKPPTSSTVAEAPAEDSSVIKIDVVHGSRVTNRVPTGSQTISGTGLEALVRVGSQQFALGNYEAAAKSYEQAIQAGGDAIVLNRRLGQAYQQLGRTSDAAEAYRKCITAVDAALAAGRGNRDSLMTTRDVCQQELKVLGG